MLAYGGPADELDAHLKMGESTVLETLREFVMTVSKVFGKEYLRPPRSEEIEHILIINLARGFPRMIGSIDCMHWEWSNCPTGWQGIYRGHKGKPTLILEAVATQDLRIWHAYFGLPGSHNDINVLHRWRSSVGGLFFPKFTVHDPYMGLGLMIAGLLEIVLGEHFCTPSPNLRI